jgi:cyclic 2,3-diphosphoglycerate synthetase
MAGPFEQSPTGADPGSIILIDGEHYPPVIARAIDALRAAGERPAVALLVGGEEKLGQVPMDVGVPVELPAAGGAESALIGLIARTGLRRVIDLSDEPVLADGARTRMASVALWCGATYEGADFRFSPPPRTLRASVPSLAVIGMGKRTGKTAIAGTAARLYREAGLGPVVIAMGRGGPGEPEVLDVGARLDPASLLDFLASGRHAASDYIEDALTAGVPTVGAWRAGGGMVGAMAYTNLGPALAAAERLHPGMVLYEGSGAAVPPARFDAGVLVANAGMDPEGLCGYFGLYRLLLADVVVFTMCEESLDRECFAAVERCARSRPLSQPHVVCTVFRPHPLADISGKKIWFGTTENERAGPVLRQHLEGTYGCKVIAVSHALARRDDLRRDLDAVAGTPGRRKVDALVVELKAAAVDVVTRWGMERELEVIYVDNRPQTVGGDGPLEALLLGAAEAARQRFPA